MNADRDAIVREIDIAAPPERVFDALTDAKQLFEWWGREESVALELFEMDARPGGRWRFRCVPTPGADLGEHGEQLRRNGADAFEAHGEVLEAVRPRLLVWSWIANWHDRPHDTTIVRWELFRTATGTRVRVTHSGFADQPIAWRDYGPGWDGVLQLLRGYVS